MPEKGVKPEILETLLSLAEHGSFNSDQTIVAAMAVLRSELMKHGDLYNGFLVSIESALKENTHDYGDGYNVILLDTPSINELAENILKRIIGEE